MGSRSEGNRQALGELLAEYRQSCEDWGSMMKDASLGRVTALEEQLLSRMESLLQDAERLDWLETVEAPTLRRLSLSGWELLEKGSRLIARRYPSIREAIDGARSAVSSEQGEKK